MSRTIPAALAMLLIATVPLAAQDDDDDGDGGGVLSISSYVCPQSAIGDIAESYDANTRPIEDELVAEGTLISAGLFFHAWADEYNVNYYRRAADIPTLLAAIAEVGQRFQAQNPDQADGPGPFAQCSQHRDNIYFMGPSTGDSDEGGQ